MIIRNFRVTSHVQDFTNRVQVFVSIYTFRSSRKRNSIVHLGKYSTKRQILFSKVNVVNRKYSADSKININSLFYVVVGLMTISIGFARSISHIRKLMRKPLLLNDKLFSKN